MILTEFDENRNAVFNPHNIIKRKQDFPKIGITCFSKKIIDKIVTIFNGEKIAELDNLNGKLPIYKIKYKKLDIAIYMSYVGSPACVMEYEDILELGLEKLIMFGTCGVLDKNIEDLAIIIPTSAIRDEGTSYHYEKASDEITINNSYIEDFKHILKEHNYSYTEGKTWTTDAIYRETKSKLAKRKQQGCICVDMESSAMAAVSKFRNKEFFQFFYAADNLDNVSWDMRSFNIDDKLEEKE